MAEKIKAAVNAAANNTKKYSKSAFLNSEKYKHRRDLLGALLENSCEYSAEEVDAKIKYYTEKGQVK